MQCDRKSSVSLCKVTVKLCCVATVLFKALNVIKFTKYHLINNIIFYHLCSWPPSLNWTYRDCLIVSWSQRLDDIY